MNSILEPKSIAIIGASSTPGKVGHDICKNLLTQGYDGSVYPINPKGGEILGVKAYSRIADVPNTVDLAIIVIPATTVPDAVKECVQKNVPTVMIISAGFSEVHTEQGRKLEEQVLQIVANTPTKIIGPNCLGLLRPSIGMNASFAKELPPNGSIALVSQSGAMAVAIMDGAKEANLGFSTVASIGNKAHLDESDWLELLENDPKTHVVGFYLESIKDGQRFMQIAKRIVQKKHIVLLKSGVSEHGKTAASSHTGALAGNDAAIDAACLQTGIHRARNSGELLNMLQVLSTQPVLLSRNIAIITNAGGPGILATDAAEKYGVHLPSFEEKTLTLLKQYLPTTAGLVNPIDVIGDADAKRYKAAIEACGNDQNIDGMCIILTPQVMTPVEEIAELIVASSKKFPLMPITTCFMGGSSVQTARHILQAGSIPTFATPEQAVQMLSMLQKRTVVSTQIQPKIGAAVLGENLPSGLLPENSAKELFAYYNLPLPPDGVAKDSNEAIVLANDIGYPVVAKISSPDIIHKTDVGGVVANIQNDAELESAFSTIMHNVNLHNPNANIQGIFIQKFLPIGNEFILGAMRDATFGPLIMVGLGGIYTELFKDTSFRIAPVQTVESYHMLEELKAWKLLLGMRGAKQSDIDAVAKIIQTLSTIMLSEPRIKEIDINPLLVGSSDVVFADVKIILS